MRTSRISYLFCWVQYEILAIFSSTRPWKRLNQWEDCILHFKNLERDYLENGTYISKHPLLLNVIQAEFTLQSLLFLKKKNRQEKITNTIVKFPSLYCTNRVNLSDHNWLCYKTDLKNFNPPVYVQVPLAEKYRHYWLKVISAISRVFDMAWVRSCQSLTYNRGLKKGRAIMVNMARVRQHPNSSLT